MKVLMCEESRCGYLRPYSPAGTRPNFHIMSCPICGGIMRVTEVEGEDEEAGGSPTLIKKGSGWTEKFYDRGNK